MDKKTIIEVKESAMECENAAVEGGNKNKRKKRRCRFPPNRGRIKRKMFSLLYKKLKLATIYFTPHLLLSSSSSNNNSS
ncbi:hypothetical protein DITRI_Ditri05aG0111300 [Diplodiscus trichospermus]